jgi:spoIIIJ-associated protein
MRSTEARAKTRKEAIQKALDELGVELHEVEIEILDEGSKGLFGFGARDVHVRVTTEAGSEPPKTRKPARGPERGKPAERARAPEQPKATERTRASEQPRRPSEPKKESGAATPPKPAPTPVSEAAANEAAALLGEVIKRMGIEAKVTSAGGEEGAVRLAVDSPDSALLIGRKGRNLEALQYLINRMSLPRDANDTSERLTVDIEGYQERRRQSLEEMAQHLARRAKETGREMRVKPLSPQERRIIHLALQDDPDVRTFSLGNSVLRSVVISPKGAENGPGNDRNRRSRGGGGSRRPAGSRGGRSRRPSERRSTP